MAIVYAEFDQLEEFGAKPDNLKSKVVQEADACDDMICETNHKLERLSNQAESDVRSAQKQLDAAQEALAREQKRVEQHNAHLADGQQPSSVSEFYYDRVDDTQEILDAAKAHHQSIQKTISDFSAYASSHRAKQNSLTVEYSGWVKRSNDFFDQYVSILKEAKAAIYERTFESGGESSSALGLENDFGHPLTDGDIATVAAAVGWPENTIKIKCTKSGNTYIYRTNNYKMEGKTSPQGVYFSRSQFTLGGLTFEGVFPEFDSKMDVKGMPESLWRQDNYAEQFNYCNAQLKNKVMSDPTFAGNFSPFQIKQIMKGKTPAGYTWHHYQTPGMLQLVRKQQHNVAYGGAAHTGGNSLWCRR